MQIHIIGSVGPIIRKISNEILCLSLAFNQIQLSNLLLSYLYLSMGKRQYPV